jgi:hypothetical protein
MTPSDRRRFKERSKAQWTSACAFRSAKASKSANGTTPRWQEVYTYSKRAPLALFVCFCLFLFVFVCFLFFVFCFLFFCFCFIFIIFTFIVGDFDYGVLCLMFLNVSVSDHPRDQAGQ